MTLTECMVLEAEQALSDYWLGRVKARLTESMIRESRAGLPVPAPGTEQQAMSMIRQMAEELQKAGDALERASRALRDSRCKKCGFNQGLATEAAVAHGSAQRAHQVASELVGK